MLDKFRAALLQDAAGQKTRRGEPPGAAEICTGGLAEVGPSELEAAVPRQQFPLGVIGSSLALVLHGGASLRRAAALQRMAFRCAGLDVRLASYHTVRLWLLRLGLYGLVRPKERAEDWIWIVDHTLQIGEHKCLVVVGIRQSEWQDREDRVLGHEDVDLIDLAPVRESNGKVVYRQLEAAAAKVGVPRAVVSDEGSDLRKGVALFQRKHRGTAWVYDIKHKTARLMKRTLEQDRAWGPFLERVHQFKQEVAQTALAGLSPPQQRAKARYMNVDVLTHWAEKHLKLLASGRAMRAAGLKPGDVEAKLGWLRRQAEPVRRWTEMLAVVEAAEHYVRHQGIHADAPAELDAAMPKVTSLRARQLRRALLDFVEEQSQQAKPSERLLGSSEVVESIIGKYKRLAGERGHHGTTAMALTFGALVGRQSLADVERALTQVRTQDVWQWSRLQLGSTVQRVRRLVAWAVSREQKRQPLGLESS